MEIASRHVYSAQGDRRAAFQLPVSKNTILPSSVRQPEISNNAIDSYFGVGKVRASSANPSRRTISNTRSSIDTTNNNFGIGNKGFYVSDESPRVSSNSIQYQQNQLQQQQIHLAKQHANFESMRANSQKMSFMADMIVSAKPSSAATTSRSFSAHGTNGLLSSTASSLQQYQPLPPGGSFRSNVNMSNNSANYHLMSAVGNNRVAAAMENINAQLSSSMPLSGNKSAINMSPAGHPATNGDGELVVSTAADPVSILSTSLGRKNVSQREKGVKKRVKFADRIATYACVSDFDVSGGASPLLKQRPSSAAAAFMTPSTGPTSGKFAVINSISATNHSGGLLSVGGTSNMFNPLNNNNSSSTASSNVSFTANLSNGTITFAEKPSNADQGGTTSLVPHPPPDPLSSRAAVTAQAANNIQTVQNTLKNQTVAATNGSVKTAANNNNLIAANKPTPSSSGTAPSDHQMLPSIDGRKIATVSVPLLVSTAAMSTPENVVSAESPRSSNSLAAVTTGGQLNAVSQTAVVTSSVFAGNSSSSSTTGKGNVSATTTTPVPTGKKKPTRPSLSEQLASIGAKAEAITSDIRVKGKLDNGSQQGGSSNGSNSLFSMPARCFSIGSLSCRFPSPVHFYSDRCEYVFNHPFESSVVNMVIYYRDMTSISILGTKFKFKLPKRLACFSTDFDPQNPHHMISIELSSMLSVSVIREKVLPLISAFK